MTHIQGVKVTPTKSLFSYCQNMCLNECTIIFLIPKETFDTLSQENISTTLCIAICFIGLRQKDRDGQRPRQTERQRQRQGQGRGQGRGRGQGQGHTMFFIRMKELHETKYSPHDNTQRMLSFLTVRGRCGSM